jgi:hypothetical protein
VSYGVTEIGDNPDSVFSPEDRFAFILYSALWEGQAYSSSYGRFEVRSATIVNSTWPWWRRQWAKIWWRLRP